MQQYKEPIASCIRLYRPEPLQSASVQAREGKLGEPLQYDQTERPIKNAQRLSRTRKPVVKPGPRAFINARSHRTPVARVASNMRSSTNITVAADILP